jgi:hypothetical protein
MELTQQQHADINEAIASEDSNDLQMLIEISNADGTIGEDTPLLTMATIARAATDKPWRVTGVEVTDGAAFSRNAERAGGMNPIPRHKTKTLTINGEQAEIDVEIVPLIELLNSIPGIATFMCCQGWPEDEEPAYVMFLDGCNERRVLQLLTGIYRQMNKQWKVYQAEARKLFDRQRSHDGMRSFEFTLEMGNGWIMRWCDGMYPDVFEAAKVVAEKMKAGKN